MVKHLVIIRGCPGVGKTTIAHQLAEKLPGNVSVVGIDVLRYQLIPSRKTDFNDHILVYNNIKDICKNTLGEGLSIIIEGLLASRNENGELRIEELENLAGKGVKISRIFLTANQETLQWRLEQKPVSYDRSKIPEWTDLAISTITTKEIIIDTSNKSERRVVQEVFAAVNDSLLGELP